VLTLHREPEKVTATDDYPNLALYSFGRGVFPKPPINGRTTSAPMLYRVRSGQFIYSRLFAFEGAFGVVPQEMDGWYVSSEYPTFNVDSDRILADFARIAICRPSVWKEMAGMTVGMGHRRQRLHPDAFLAYEIDLPSLYEQRGIVRAVGAGDDLVAAYLTEASSARILLDAARSSLVVSLHARPVSELVSKIEAGKSPQALDRPPRHGERGVLKVSSIRASEFRAYESKAVDDAVVFPAHARVRGGDVLISRANTRTLVGATCRVEGDFPSLYLSDKTLRLVVKNEVVDPDFLVHTLASSVARQQIEDGASGTSDSMKNISQKTIFGLEVPHLDDLDEQRRIATQLNELRRTVVAAARLAESTRRLRVAVVESLLTGERAFDQATASVELGAA
jgi:type I restriction enzyme S subunit